MSKKHRLQMQRRPQAHWPEPLITPEPVKEESKSMNRNRINQYTCSTCGGIITTFDRDEGTTPAMLACRVTDGCEGTMRSAYYMVDQTLKPDYEWYKPAKLPRDPDMRQHVQMGGLLLRKAEV